MPVRYAPECSARGCRRSTRNPSGLCHDHVSRTPGVSTKVTVPPPPELRFRPPTDRPEKRTYRHGATPEADESHEVIYELDGKPHRVGAPAVTYFEDGRMVSETYYTRGFPGRLDGPSLVVYEDGEIVEESFSVRGAGVQPQSIAGIGIMLEKTPEADRIELLIDSPYRELLDEGIDHSVITGALREEIGSLSGIRALAAGSPLEWVRAYEEGAAG